jgi:hypothetical protein
MLSQQAAEEFARDWIKAWNDHDLEKILVTMVTRSSSPVPQS